MPVSFEEALNLIAQSILNTLPNENGFFIGARLTNEEMYLIQKLARFVVKTNNISSFHYLERGKSYFTNSNKNVPFEELKNASKFYVLGNNIFKNSPVLGYELVNIKKIKNIPIKLISTQKDIQATNKANETFIIKNYYYFIKAVNHYLLSKNLENQLFIKDRCKGFDNYKDK
ncbi:MAG TPA: molybdopterin-dependent oxidoreductase, partial [Bacteroidales bacterium]|nr:molybdopterin-dependent oxidoreductase [Bacteroidales bacterium]